MGENIGLLTAATITPLLGNAWSIQIPEGGVLLGSSHELFPNYTPIAISTMMSFLSPANNTVVTISALPSSTKGI